MSESIVVNVAADRAAIERWESEGGRAVPLEEDSLRARSGELPRTDPEGDGSSSRSRARSARKRLTRPRS